MQQSSSKSILYKLMVVLLVLTSLTIVNAVVAWFAFERIDFYQSIVVEESIPSVARLPGVKDLESRLVKLNVALSTPQDALALEASKKELANIESKIKSIVGEDFQLIRSLIDRLMINVKKQLLYQEELLQDKKNYHQDYIELVGELNRALALLRASHSEALLSFDAVPQVLSNLINQLQLLKTNIGSIASADLMSVSSIAIVRQGYQNYLRNVSLVLQELEGPYSKEIIASLYKMNKILKKNPNLFLIASKIVDLDNSIRTVYLDSVNLAIQIDQEQARIYENQFKILDGDNVNTDESILIAKISMVIVAVLSVLVSFLVYQFFIKPKITDRLKKLTINTEKISEGDYLPIHIDDEGDEITSMELALDDFRKALIEKALVDQQMRDQRKRLSVIINQSAEGLFTVDLNHIVISANPACLKIFNCEPDDMVGVSVMQFFPEAGEIFRYRESYNRLQEGEGVAVCTEKDILAAAFCNHFFTANLSVSLIAVTEGKVFSCFVRDVSKQRQDQKKIEALVKELRESNADLESFAYSCSHDLQEPVRIIASFSELLSEELRDSRNEKVKKYLHFILDSARSSQQLIRDILDYSRAGKSEGDIKPILMSTIFERLAPLFEHVNNGTLEFMGGTIKVFVREAEIFQVLLNLISNAFKFNQSEVPKVSVLVREVEHEWLFSVTDNGIGIDSAYFDQIFQLFKRLARRSEYEGSGIGLAKCQRIVSRWEGRIWVDSVVGEGSTFHISLPRPEAGPEHVAA